MTTSLTPEAPTEHTPGPWGIIATASGKPGIVPDHPQSARDIARCQDDAEGWANARLIAAAPEMLEALEAAVNEVESDEETVRKQPDWLRWARAAIAKATGAVQ